MVKSPERWFRTAMWLVSLVFAGFLIGLGGKLMADMPAMTRPVQASAPLAPETQRARAQIQRLTQQMQSLNTPRAEAQGALDERRNAYNAAREAHSNWLATRHATANNPAAQQQDPELLRQTRQLESLNAQVRQAQVAVEALDAQVLALRGQIETQEGLIDAERARLEPDRLAAQRLQELQVFGFRLLLTLPLLVVAGWLVVRKRHSPHWPLARGFVLFAGFAFFFELVPYLPSYGGYVRYAVGILLSLLVGHYGIRWMQGYLQRRQLQAQRNEAERRATLDSVAASQKVQARLCPGCDRATPPEGEGAQINHCVYCGLKLFDHCGASLAAPDGAPRRCGVRKNAYFLFCPTCGSAANAAAQAA